MTNIAQMINVLQAMILTDGPKMVLTPTYHVYHMYVPFQDATLMPVSFTAGTYRKGDIILPRVDAVAARDPSGKLWLALTNIDPNQPTEIVVAVGGSRIRSAAGQVLTAARVDSVNRFDAADSVSPKPVKATAKDGRLMIALPPKSVTVLALEAEQ
jgi:alpha-N-arabinofuranosidase